MEIFQGSNPHLHAPPSPIQCGSRRLLEGIHINEQPLVHSNTRTEYIPASVGNLKKYFVTLSPLSFSQFSPNILVLTAGSRAPLSSQFRGEEAEMPSVIVFKTHLSVSVQCLPALKFPSLLSTYACSPGPDPIGLHLTQHLLLRQRQLTFCTHLWLPGNSAGH